MRQRGKKSKSRKGQRGERGEKAANSSSYSGVDKIETLDTDGRMDIGMGSKEESSKRSPLATKGSTETGDAEGSKMVVACTRDDAERILKELNCMFQRFDSKIEQWRKGDEECRNENREIRNDLVKMIEKTSGEMDDLRRKFESMEEKWREKRLAEQNNVKEQNNVPKKEKWEAAVKCMKSDIKEQNERLRALEEGKNTEQEIDVQKELREEIKSMKWKFEMEERRRIRKNVIISGIKFGKKEDIKGWIKRKLRIDISPSRIWVTRSKDEKLGLELKTVAEKEELMRKKSDLKGSTGFIDNDLTWEERRIRSVIREKARKLKEIGEEVKTGYKKLIANGLLYIWDERENKLVQKDRDKQDSQTKSQKSDEGIRIQ